MRQSPSIRVMVAGDRTLVGGALTALIEGTERMSVAGEAFTNESAIEVHARIKPDVLVVNLRISSSLGIDLIHKVTASSPNVRVIAISDGTSLDRLLPVLRAGASGFISKDDDPAIFIQSIREVHEGHTVLCRTAVKELTSFVVDTPQPLGLVVASVNEHLTPCENKVLTQLAKGLSNSDIAMALYLSESTVKGRIAKIMLKWGVRTRIQLLIRAIRMGFVSLGCAAIVANCEWQSFSAITA